MIYSGRSMTLVVKLGSSIVADDRGGLRTDVLDSVCSQVASLASGGESLVLVTSGSIAMGITRMEMEARPRSIDELQAASAIGQGPLFNEYGERLGSADLAAAQVLLTAGDVANRTAYLNARQTLRRLLEWDVVPVVNENDTTATDEITFGDNDFLAAQVAIMMEARLLVLLTDIEGLYTADPGTDPSAELVREVDDFDRLAGMEIGDRTSVFGSGGMRSKVAAAQMATRAGVEARICDGTSDGTLTEAVAGGETGTRFPAADQKESGFKLWLLYAKPANGAVSIDEGAARVLRETGSSLLPVGVIGIDGRFEAGDAVEVRLGDSTIGKGIANFSAAEVEQIAGKRSAEVQGLVPNGPEEVIHRDKFVLA